ncbi:hypothetical protein EYR41_006086 [Orbilia oligospora]|uniref:Uncharacterized protein n=1 Tax=Orbilia oligospora TaxID=2813651 RepID=A0A8H2HS60_ORBOL|nr:hypothetical protein EYR41_006086 [Orbilia oligospora]
MQLYGQEILCYLKFVYDCWQKIMSGTDTTELDALSVQQLQGRDPRSTGDSYVIHNAFWDSSLFKNYQLSERETIRGNIFRLHHPIGSLHTFLEDLKYLEVCAIPLKTLFPPESGQTVSTVAQLSWTVNTTHQPVEFAEGRQSSSTKKNNSLTSDEAFNLAYIQIWLYAMRNFHEISKPARKDAGGPKPVLKEASPWYTFKMCSLSKDLGFNNIYIEETLKGCPYKRFASRILQECSFDDLDIRSEGFGNSVESLGKCIQTFVEKKGLQPKFQATQGDPDSLSEEKQEKRWGRPFARQHEHDRKYLFLPEIVRDLSLSKRNFTSFEARRYFFLAFWGDRLTEKIKLLAQTFLEHVVPEIDMEDQDNSLQQKHESFSSSSRDQMQVDQVHGGVQALNSSVAIYNDIDERLISPSDYQEDILATQREQLDTPPNDLQDTLMIDGYPQGPRFLEYYQETSTGSTTGLVPYDKINRDNTRASGITKEVILLVYESSNFIQKRIYQDMQGRTPNKIYGEIRLYLFSYDEAIKATHLITSHTIYKQILDSKQIKGDMLKQHLDNRAAKLKNCPVILVYDKKNLDTDRRCRELVLKLQKAVKTSGGDYGLLDSEIQKTINHKIM